MRPTVAYARGVTNAESSQPWHRFRDTINSSTRRTASIYRTDYAIGSSKRPYHCISTSALFAGLADIGTNRSAGAQRTTLLRRNTVQTSNFRDAIPAARRARRLKIA